MKVDIARFDDLVREPLQAAETLMKLLMEIEQSGKLDLDRDNALNHDKQFLENLIMQLTEVRSRDDLENLWASVRGISHFFGGYVGDDLGVQLRSSMLMLEKTMFEAIAESRQNG